MTAAQNSGGDDTGRRDALPAGFLLNAYRVERVLGSGGFGIVYLAHHEDLDRQVAIKEYLPIECAVRDGSEVNARGGQYREAFEEGLTRFRDEARRLVDLDEHPAIISCRDFFRTNGTAYLAMEYAEGQPLSEVLRAREAEGRPFGQSDLMDVIVPLLEGLAQVHAAGIIHRDIKPGNILIRKTDGRPVLLDFGAAKQGLAELSKSMAPFTEGYAAFEQVGEGRLGPWTDIYAVGAVMWRMVAGGNPPWMPPTPTRVESRVKAQLSGDDDPLPSTRMLGKGRFSAEVLRVIEDCLRLKEGDRIQGCDELLRILSSKPALVVSGIHRPVGGPPRPRSIPSPKSNSQWLALSGAGLGLFGVLAVGLGAHVTALVLLMVALGLITASWTDEGRQEKIAKRNQIAVQEAASQGDADAQHALGYMYANGEGVPEDNNEAVAWYRKAADQGNADAQYSLGYMYANGEGVPGDNNEAVAWYRKAADQGNADAQYSLGYMYASGEGVPRDRSAAHEWYRKAADQGNVGAQYSLAYMYANGEGVTRDSKRAVAWYRKAAKQGDANAQANLGLMLAKGTGVQRDRLAAHKWYWKAAYQGNVEAQYRLAYMYANGEGVIQDNASAVEWYRAAARQGDAKAQANLGLMLAKRTGFLQEAMVWLRKAADQGNATAQASLGDLYASRRRKDLDDGQAAVWLRKAADQGKATAQVSLGEMYASGRGVPQDDGQAVAWYRKAADQGNGKAQYGLGSIYANSESSLKDYVRAYAWWNVAAAKGYEDAGKQRTRIGKRMTPEQISEAQSLSHQLMPKNTKPNK